MNSSILNNANTNPVASTPALPGNAEDRPVNNANRDAAVLVVGADGLIGNALYTFLQQAGERVYATTRRAQPTYPTGTSYLDLETDPDSWVFPSDLRTAFVCAGVCRLNLCREQSQSSYLINVDRTAHLVQQLAKKGCFTVYLSSNRVFDGTRAHLPTNAPYNPATEYGRQKAAAEQRILTDGPGTAVVRLTKVMAPTDTVLNGWKNDLLHGRAIYPFNDVVFSPVALSSVVSVLRLIGDCRQGGLWHLSAEEEPTYLEAAHWVCSDLGADAKLVQGRSYRDAGLHDEIRLEHSTLDVRRLQRDLGIRLPSARDVIRLTLNL